jgi:methyl-accepting chemotaxis protein
MNRILQVVIIIILVFSLAGNLMLGLFLFNTIQKVGALTGDLSKTNEELSTVKADLAQSETDLQSAVDELKQKTEKLKEATNALTVANRTLKGFMCPVTIPAEAIEKALTNNALVDPITKAEEEVYASESVNTTFDVFWNNSRTAIFTVDWSDQTTSKVLVTWAFDDNDVSAISSVGEGCFYYLP